MSVPQTNLSVGCTSAATTLTVVSVKGWPTTYPYFAILDAGLTDEETVLVTAATGTTLTVTRGVNSTAVAHSAGVTVNQPYTSPSVIPIGGITQFGGSTAPAGWLLCDGSPVSRSTYSAVFAVIGTTYGVGDGSTTFNLPDLRNRFPLGAGTAAAGTTGGNQGHSHTLSDAGQAALSNPSAAQINMRQVTSATWTQTHALGVTSETTSSSTRTAGTALTGATDSNTDTRPPWLSSNYILRIA